MCVRMQSKEKTNEIVEASFYKIIAIIFVR